MNLIEMVEEFGDRVDGPVDYTSCYWERTGWGISWTEEGADPDDDFDYSSETRRMYQTNRYMICTVDNGCGETYQAVFDLLKEVQDV